MADDSIVVPAIEPNRYQQIIERIFFSRDEEGAHDVEFARDDMVRVATELGIVLPKNLGDVVYSFRYRIDLPKSVQDKAPTGQEWIIQPAKRSRYRFHATVLETHYRLVSPDSLTPSDLDTYRSLSSR